MSGVAPLLNVQKKTIIHEPWDFNRAETELKRSLFNYWTQADDFHSDPRMLTTGLILSCFSAVSCLVTFDPSAPTPSHCKSTASIASDPGHAFSTTGSFSNPTFFVSLCCTPYLSCNTFHVWIEDLTVKEIDLASVRSANGAQLASEKKNGHRKWKNWNGRERIKHRRMRVPSRSSRVCMLLRVVRLADRYVGQSFCSSACEEKGIWD